MKPTLTKELQNEIKKYVMSLDKNKKVERQKIIALYQLLVESRKTVLQCDDVTMIEDETIVSKKFNQIKMAETNEDIKGIMDIPKIELQGEEFKPVSSWTLPEEELLMWSKASLDAKPGYAGYARYRALFLQLFPNA